jgi:adhesin HecA-like repeat protein
MTIKNNNTVLCIEKTNSVNPAIMNSLDGKTESIVKPKVEVDPFDLYWQHYQRYLDDNNSNLGDLINACHYLSLSACLGYVGAKSSLHSNPDNLLSCHLPKIIADELIVRLEEISPQSPQYDQAKVLLGLLYYSRRDYTDYANYEERFVDIYYALKHFNARKKTRKTSNEPLFEAFLQTMLIGYPTDVTEESIIESTWRILTLELTGEDALSLVSYSNSSQLEGNKPLATHHYSFPIIPVNEMRKISVAIGHQSEVVDNFLQSYQAYRVNHINTVDCSAELNQSYVFCIPAEWLQNPSKPILCFRDKKTQQEVARFEFSQGKFVFKAYGKAIHIAIKGQLDISTCIFENPGSTLTLAADIQSEGPISLAADMEHFTLQGNIKSSDKVTVESSGLIELPTQSTIQSSDSDIFIKAKAMRVRGKIHSAGRGEWLVQEGISMMPDSESYAKQSLKITAGALKDIRGKIISDGQMEIKANDKIYLHGSAEMRGKALSITTKAMMATDKSKIQAQEMLHIEKIDKLVVDKESRWSAPEININAKEFTNYTPYLSAIKAHIHCEDHFTQHPQGKITTKGELKFTGGSIWNAGKLHYGQGLKVKLNKYCVLGLTELSSFSRVKEAFSCAELKGDNAEIIAGVFFNFVGGIEVRNLSVSSILKVDVGVTRLKTSQKSCVVELDCGVTIPNIQAYYDDIKNFFNLIEKEEYGAALKLIFNCQNGISLLSAGRSIFRTIVPGAGKGTDLAWSTLMTLCSSKKLYDQAVALNQTRKDKPLELSDIIQLVVSSSNVASQLVTIESQAASISLDDLSLAGADLPSYKIPSLALSSLSAFSPSNLDDSVIGLGLGSIQTGGSVTHRSLLSYEQGCAQVGFNVSNSFYIKEQDNTLTVANVASNTGHQSSHSGITIALGAYNNVDEQIDSARTISVDAAWHSKHLQLAGETDSIDVQAIANNLVDDSHITAKNHATLIGKDHLERTEKADLTAMWTTVSSEGQNINAGKINSTAPIPVNPAPKSTPTATDVSDKKTDTTDPLKTTEEEKPIPTPPVIIHGQNVVLTNTSNINALGQTVSVISNTTTDNGTCNAAIYIDNAKSHLDVGKDAHHHTTEAIVYESKAGTLDGQTDTKKLSLNIEILGIGEDADQKATEYVAYKSKEALLNGHISTNQLFLDIDNLSNHQLDALLNRTDEFKGFNPTSLLSIKTLSDIILTHNYELPLSVEINGKRIEIHGNIHSTGDLIFTATNGDISNYNTHIQADHNLVFDAINGAFNNFYGNLSAKIVYVHSRDNITNIAGTVQAETQLRLISDTGGLVNQGDLRNQVYTGARLVGGNGNGYDNVGLAIKTAGTLLNKGSSITSQANAALDVGRVDNVAADYTTIETKTVIDTVSLTNPEKLALYSAENRPNVTIITKQGSEVIPTGSRQDPNSRATLALDRVHDTSSIVVTPPVLRTVSVAVDHTVSSHIEAKGTLSAEVKQGDWNNVHSTTSADTILMDITHSNLNNTAGLVQGDTFIGIHAIDINNTALAHKIDGALGGEDKVYEAGVILGGSGQGHEGIGMVLQAEGVIHLLGSIISSKGDNVLLGKHGIDSRAMHNTYISYHRETSNWCGRDTETTE